MVGTGDDCAVVRIPGAKHDLVYTTDAVIEGVHFGPKDDPKLIGHKAVGRVLSDFASMGADALHILINLVAPATCPVARIEGIYRGAVRLARQFGVAMVGGDTAKGRTLELHVFGVGSVPRGRAVLRSGAKPGDAIYVTGRLGGSLSGRHLSFVPRLKEGRWLQQGAWASSMIDLSDGLATDLRHIMNASGVGADLVESAIPRSRDCSLRQAVTDGEDFELLFTVSARKAQSFERAWKKTFRLPVSRIGRILRGGNVPSLLQQHGFEHFR
jgi:thiamine-monophosphate kinase